MSYSFMGECHGFDKTKKKFNKLESKVVKLGLEPLDIQDFISAGGYGKPLPEVIYKKGYKIK